MRSTVSHPVRSFVARLAFLVSLAAVSLLTTPATAQKSGIDQSLFSETVEPGENFYLYANQKWLESTEIPRDKKDYGIFTVLSDRTREDVRELIEDAANREAKQGSPTQKVGDLYNSVLNLEARNHAGIEPIEPMLEIVDGIETRQDLAAAIGKLTRQGVYGPLAPYVGVDAKDSQQYAVYMTQAGITLPDRDYYLKDDQRYQTLRQELVVYIHDMLGRISDDRVPLVDAGAVYKIESALARSQWTRTENRDPVKTYNAKDAKGMVEAVDGFAWKSFAEEAGIAGQDKWVIRQPSFAAEFGQLIATTPLDEWKSYLRFHVLDSYASSLTEDLERRHFEFHDAAVSGVDEQEELWKRGVNVTGSVLGEVVGQLYVEQYFTPDAKQRMSELVENLKTAFRQRIGRLEWMGEGTKKQALAKLEKFTTKIGYPDQWKDYEALTIEDRPLAENLIAASKFEYQRDLDKLGGPIDRTEWHMTPQTINAYYNPTMNEIVFPAAILQPPFFDMNADDAVNYGAIGAVIGHEISHGFDDKGSEYDGDGNLRKWWTPEDREEFVRRADFLIDQYSGFQPFEDMNVNGKMTLGENIGDLGGLSVSHAAYRLSLDGQDAPVIDGLTGDQRFFLGWAQIWRRLYREAELKKRLLTDVHSPSEYRVNGIVRNMDAWYEAFDVQPNDELYLAPEDRVRIW